MVGAVLVKGGKIIGRGWHRRAGLPHAEIEALRDAEKRGNDPKGATLYVTLEPCCTQGRTPPCTGAIVAAGIKRVVAGSADSNPKHAGKGFKVLEHAGIEVVPMADRADRSVHNTGLSRKRRARVEEFHQELAQECARLNEPFNHWIVHHTPFVTVKAAMTLDGKIATASGESKWITGGKARAHGMKLRQGNDAILVGINTILKDDPGLTFRANPKARDQSPKRLRRIVLDSRARTPLNARVVTDGHAMLTTIVVGPNAPKSRVAALAKQVKVLVAPLDGSKLKTRKAKLNLRWLLKRLGREDVTSLLIEGGGEVNASFLLDGLAQRAVFFYAPRILGGRDSRKGVAGDGVTSLVDAVQLCEVEWKQLGPDLLLTARVAA
jgi:diaminohydroxyphosphoribosylaminopyrimidine deaminase/5-amino-6-(5-phosphoribosylamino)uracil reductase